MPSLFTVIKFRKSCIPYLRLQRWTLTARRLKTFIERAVNKLMFRRKKVLPDKGMVIAISGVDGAGKSTMLAEASKVLNTFLTVDQYHLGKPQGSVLESIRRFLAKYRKRLKKDRGSEFSYHPANSTITFQAAILDIFLAFLRFRLALKAKRQAECGHLVLVDRWPTCTVGQIDGPQIYFDTRANRFVRFCGNIEQWLYKRIPEADVCFHLSLPLTMAIIRNQSRIKYEKETDDDIKARYNRTRNSAVSARKTIVFDNAGDLSIKLNEFLKQLWIELVNHREQEDG